jgi:hypothetical protein
LYLRVLFHSICLENRETLQNWMNVEGKNMETLFMRLKLVLTRTVVKKKKSSITTFFSVQWHFQNKVNLDGHWCPLHSGTTVKPTNDAATQRILLDVNRMLHVAATEGSLHQAIHKGVKRVICPTAFYSLWSQTLQCIPLMKYDVSGYCSVDGFHTWKNILALGSLKFM